MDKYNCNQADIVFGKILGRGQFGVVYQGTYKGEPVAIKKISYTEESIPFEEDLYLQREIEILHSLTHPHVLQFKGVCKLSDAIEILTEFAEGGDLRKYLQVNRPTWPQRLRISLQIAQAIEYLHSRNIVHRDIKTDNVLMDTKYNAKLCDFGFAREVDSKTANNYTFCGTEFFEAPEIMFCMDYDERVDIFSYGMVLCEILSRKQPTMSTFRRVVPGFGIDGKEIRSLAEEGCPDILISVASQCCLDEPDQRPNLVDVVMDFRVAYKDVSGEAYVDLKTKEQVEAEEKKRLEQEKIDKEIRELDEAEHATAVVFRPLHSASIRVKQRETTIKLEPEIFQPPTTSKLMPARPMISPPSPLPDRASLDGKDRTLHRGKEEVPDLIRIGRLLLSNKYVQTTKTDQERWGKFLIAFPKSIQVNDRQIRVLGRIRTYRKCFTAEDVLEAISNLEPEIHQKKALLDLADLLVKLGFFFPVVGGTTFKEKSLYRFHADEVKFHGK